MASFILGGGPGAGRGVHATTSYRGNQLAQRIRALTAASNGGLRADYQRISRELQGVVVAEVDTGLKRPGASTGKLHAVTASSRNRKAGDDFFIVGDPDYLKASKVKYALAIEFGSTYEVDRHRRLVGVWISGGQFLPFGSPSPNQFFRVTSARVARRLIDNQGPVSGYITTPIMPHDDYGQAWKTYNPRRQILLAVNKRLSG